MILISDILQEQKDIILDYTRDYINGIYSFEEFNKYLKVINSWAEKEVKIRNTLNQKLVNTFS
jgi:hypothetical protein